MRSITQRRRTSLLFTVVSALLWCSSASALTTDGVLWGQFFWQGPKEWKVRPYFELQERMGASFSQIEHLLFRPAVVIAPTPEMSFWLGYAWTPSFRVNTSTFTSEQRLWQQFTYTFTLTDRIALTTRTRFEERFVPGAAGLGLRARELLRLHLAFDDSKVWQFVAWDELFWQLNTISPTITAGYNQNRVLVGAYLRAFENFHIELGYLNVLAYQPDVSDLKWSHGVLLGIYTGL